MTIFYIKNTTQYLNVTINYLTINKQANVIVNGLLIARIGP